nr:zinc finger BED domain-containing protein RICESLEEPER 2-like [Tanacetum cinerariifolium]
MLVVRLKALGVPLSGLRSRVLGLKSLINVLEVLDVKALRVWYDLEEVDFGLHIVNKGHSVPRSEDWVKAKRLCHFLKTFYDITLRIFGTKYVTSHTLVNELATIRALLRAKLDCDIHGVAPTDKHLYDIATAMKPKFEKYYGEVENMSLLVYFAFILDPRNKYEFLDVIVDDHYGREGISVVEKKDYIKGKMKLLYEDYICIHAPCSTSSSTLGKRPRSINTSHEIDHGDMLRRRMKTGQSSSSSTSELDKYSGVLQMGIYIQVCCKWVSAMVLKKMKEVAEEYIGTKVTDDVITVPAYFNNQ